MMLHLKSSVATLSILVTVVTAMPYSEWEREGRYRWNDIFAANRETAVRTQAAVDTSACATITETKNEKSYRVRICTADSEDASAVCLGTRVKPCCAGNFNNGNLVSSKKVNVGGEDVTVSYYLTKDQAVGVCYRLDDSHLNSKTCSLSVGESCLPPCSSIVTACFNNTETGDRSSCVDDVCRCKEGYLPPDCCKCDTTNFYGPTCKPFCRRNCRSFIPRGSGCATCNPGYISPPECCDCDTVGNATHAFYKTPTNECLPFCKNNCAVRGSSGCITCKTGYEAVPECCQCRRGFTQRPDGTCESECSINQNIYFLLDGTRQNYAFCTMGITIHMLVAAFNPGSSLSGTRLSTVLFPRNGVSNVVFNIDKTCDEIKGTLKSLQTQMQTCQDNQQTDKSSITYTSLCGSNTVAVAGLDKIRSLIPSPATTDSAVVILTDGKIDDPADMRERALDDLADSGLRVQSIIAGGVRNSGATDANLKLYNRKDTVNDRVVLADDAIGLGLELVREMKDVGLICPKLAGEITSELKKVQNDKGIRNTYCQCHNIRTLKQLDDYNYKCDVGYPTCGGPVSISAAQVPKQQESLSLEEEILAAVENVLQRFEG